MAKTAIAVLISGRGSNMIALHEAIRKQDMPASIACAISSSAKAPGLQYAREHDIPAISYDDEVWRDPNQAAEALLKTLAHYNIELIVLAGFLKKIPEKVVAAYANRIINIHPALLPAFGGKGMYGRHVHEAVLAYGCKVSGATVHFVASEYDTGPPILQECVPVQPDDTAESLAARVLQLEHRLLPKCVDLLARGKVHIEGRTVRIEA